MLVVVARTWENEPESQESENVAESEHSTEDDSEDTIDTRQYSFNPYNGRYVYNGNNPYTGQIYNGQSTYYLPYYGYNGQTNFHGHNAYKGYNGHNAGDKGHGTSGYGPPGYETTGYGTTGYGTPGYGASGYGVSGYGASGYGANVYGATGYGVAGYGASGYGTSGYDTSGYGASSGSTGSGVSFREKEKSESVETTEGSARIVRSPKRDSIYSSPLWVSRIQALSL